MGSCQRLSCRRLKLLELDQKGASASHRGPLASPHPPAQLRQEELAFVLDESAQLFLKTQPHSSGLSRAEGIQLSQQVTSGVGGGSTLYTVLQHLQSYIITTRNNGLYKRYAMSCAASCSGNTIRPGKHYLLSITLEFGENKQINHPPITADWIKVSVKS